MYKNDFLTDLLTNELNEDNLIALATIDVLNIYKDGARVIPYYVELGNRLLAKIASPIYDENRGKDGFLDGKEF